MSSRGYRRKCLAEKGEECINCGAEEGIEVHHLDGDRTNNELKNLIPLCNKCHSTLHRTGLNGLEEHLLPRDDRVVTYNLNIDGEVWENWKNTVPRSKSLHKRVEEIVRADLEGRVLDHCERAGCSRTAVGKFRNGHVLTVPLCEGHAIEMGAFDPPRVIEESTTGDRR